MNASCETSLISVIRAMMHDESTYENPFEFNPDRFDCENPPRDPHLVAFGFGRRWIQWHVMNDTKAHTAILRICPGLALASSTIFLFVAQVLASFNIRKAVDESGAEVVPQAKFTSGVIRWASSRGVQISPDSYSTLVILSHSNIICRQDQKIRPNWFCRCRGHLKTRCIILHSGTHILLLCMYVNSCLMFDLLA